MQHILSYFISLIFNLKKKKLNFRKIPNNVICFRILFPRVQKKIIKKLIFTINLIPKKMFYTYIQAKFVAI